VAHHHRQRRAALVIAACILSSATAFAQAFTLAQVEESIAAIGDVVQREYADKTVGKLVASSLREGLSEGRFPNLATAGDVAAAMNHELDFLTHDKSLVVSVVRNPRAKPADPKDAHLVRINDALQIAIPTPARR
jgi:hypothetical protein